MAIEVYTTDGLGGCFVICLAEALTNPVCRSILDRALKAIDAFFLRRLKFEQGLTKANSAKLSLLAAQLSAILDSLALRTRAGWSAERLRSRATGLIRQTLGGERTS